MNLNNPKDALITFFREVTRSYWILVRIMVPALIVVRLLEVFGVTEWLGVVLGPLMSPLGLSSEMGLVWGAAILTNIYTAMAVFYELSAGQSFSVAQISIVGVLVLLSHAIPVEGAVARVLHVPWRLTIALRVGGGYLLALLTYWACDLSGFGAESATSLWQPEARAEGWMAWSWEQVQLLFSVFVILAGLMAGLRFLRWIGFEKVMGILLLPLINIMRVDRRAANVTIIGLMLGLSFGAGLLIDAAKSGEISKRDMQVVACFLGMCHSIIEDTLLIMLLGADIIPILIGRFVFSCLVIYGLSRVLIPKDPESGNKVAEAQGS